MIKFPNYLLPISALTEPVQIVGEITQKMDKNGAQKFSAWAGMPGWVVPVEIVRGTTTKRLPTGRTVETLELARISVTVWAASQPVVPTGAYAQLTGLGIGAVEGNIFVQATGISEVPVAEDAPAAAALFGDEDA